MELELFASKGFSKRDKTWLFCSAEKKVQEVETEEETEEEVVVVAAEEVVVQPLTTAWRSQSVSM